MSRRGLSYEELLKEFEDLPQYESDCELPSNNNSTDEDSDFVPESQKLSSDSDETTPPLSMLTRKNSNTDIASFLRGSRDRTKRRRIQSIGEQHSVYTTEMSFRTSGKLDAAKLIQDITEGDPTKATRIYEKGFLRGSRDRTKRRRIQSIGEQHSVYTTEMSFRTSGKLDAAKLIQDITEGDPTKATRYRESLNRDSKKKITKDDAPSYWIGHFVSSVFFFVLGPQFCSFDL
ncbi:hypothetical protein FQA39_LY15123 [Lamprigera yunnana]|nr:hypothetical protein FQA39_LY15123 [Lamprigera yunnana]